jgi:hypothetical protein
MNPNPPTEPSEPGRSLRFDTNRGEGRRRLARLLLLAATCALPRLAPATDYHVDVVRGDDAGDGRSPRHAWRSLERVQAASLAPGDRVRFRRGSVWSGQLRIVEARGEPGRPIRFEAWGRGARPRIDTAGAHEDAVLVRNSQHVELADLEVTNRGEASADAPRRGVHVVADNCGSLTNLVLADLFVHDVNGTQKRKDNGGIIFRTRGERVPSRFVGLRIERNIVWRVDRSGIAAQSSHANRTRWFPSPGVVIRDNWLGDLGGDGIVPWATEGALVEHNILVGANERADSYNAGIWPWSTDDTVVRLNRASGVKTLKDGQGFDSDYNSRNTLLEYNLSHDNQGGFLLICSPGQRNPADNWGNRGTIARHNISRNDRARTFHVSAVEDTLVERNAVYIGPGLDVQAVLLTDWTGWPTNLEFRGNLFVAEGTARYGHEIGRTPEGAYRIAPGWGPSAGVGFHGNRYLGNHVDRPEESVTEPSQAPDPLAFDDWPGPQFNPRQPDRFPAFLRAHRRWMLRLMERQFGTRPP